MLKKVLLPLLIIANFVGAFSLSINQPSFHVVTNKGANDSYSLKITNNNDQTVYVRAYVQDWQHQDNGAKLFLPVGQSNSSCSSWIELSKKELTIPPKTTVDYSFRLKTPRDAVGGSQSVIFFEAALPEDVIAESAIAYGIRLGTIIYQETKDHTKHNIEVLESSVKNIAGDTHYTLSIRNGGNSWNSVKANFTLSNESLTSMEATQAYRLMPAEKSEIKGVFKGEAPLDIFFVLEDIKGNLYTGTIPAVASGKAGGAVNKTTQKVSGL